MAERIVLHIGAPKSGTTYLQTILWRNRAALRGSGVLVPGQSLGDYNRAAKALRIYRRGKGPAGAAWRRICEETAQWPGTVVLSSEWFCLVPEDLVARVVEELPDAELHVVFTARSFLGQVPAAWQETLKLGTGQSLDSFVDDLENDGERWSWWAIDPAVALARWASVVPAERLHVVTVPPRGEDPDLLWKRFAGLCGVDPAIADTEVAQANESLGVEAAALLQRLGPLIHERIDFSELSWTEPYRWLRRYLGHELLVPLSGGRIALSDTQRAAVQARSERSVATLRSAGYPVTGDLDELLGGNPAGTHPDDVTASEMLAVALPVAATLLAELRTQTLRAEAAEERLRVLGQRDADAAGSEDTGSQPAGPASRVRGPPLRTLTQVRDGAGRRLRSLRHAVRPARPRTDRVCFLLADAAGRGGVARTVMNLADELAADHQVEIVSVNRNKRQPVYPTQRDVPVRWLVDKRGRALRRLRESDPAEFERRERLAAQPSLFGGTDTAMSRYADERLEELLKSLAPGVLISTRPSLHGAAAQLAPPHLLTVGQEHLNFITRSERPGPFQTIKRAAPALDGFVVLTEADKQDWRRALAGTGAYVEAIPNSLTWDLGPQAPLQEKVVVAAGRFEERKGFVRMVEAYAPLARERPDWQLHIYGGGEEAPAIRRCIDELGVGDHIHLMGFTDQLQEAFQAASVYAMTSHFEGLPMVLLEAMSQGLPLVSMDCPRGPAELIEDGVSGRLVANGDLAGFTEALRSLMDDADLRTRMGAAGLAKAADYRVDAVAQRWTSLFETLLERRAARRS